MTSGRNCKGRSCTPTFPGPSASRKPGLRKQFTSSSSESLLHVLVGFGDERCVNPEYDLVREKYEDLLPELIEQRRRRLEAKQ